MLTSLLGIRLVLLMGAAVPLPAPAAAMHALKHVKVINDADGQDGFQITFTLGKDKLGEYSLLASGALNPDRRVVIGVVLGASLEALIDGVIYHHQIAPSNEPGMSTLTVSGRDISVLLDLEEKNALYQNRPDSLIVTEILAGYAQYGLVPQAMPTTDVPIELYRVPRQHETDLQFIRRMAQRNGYVFYIEPLTLGASTAYFGPENRAGLPQPALSVDMGTATNVNSLDFMNDALAPVAAKGSFVEPITKTSIPIPPLPSLRVPPLVGSPAAARRTKRMRRTASQGPGLAAITALAATTSAPDAVTARGQVDTVRYGSVLRARRLVGVRGAGLQNDGLYYVRQVTHEIEVGKYTQDFSLSREGTGTLAPVVRP
jgi:hypothetical protein